MLQITGHIICLQAMVRGQGGVATAPHLAAGVTVGADRLADEATAGEQTLNQTDSRCFVQESSIDVVHCQLLRQQRCQMCSWCCTVLSICAPISLLTRLQPF